MNKHNDIFCIINSAGSINCKTKENYFFNSQFDVIFQRIVIEREINVKYLSFNSTKIFSSALDNYALSKKDLDNNFENVNMFYSLYIDLVFDDYSPHFKTIQEKIRSIKTKNKQETGMSNKNQTPKTIHNMYATRLRNGQILTH